jgi:predicted transcriptional regulator
MRGCKEAALAAAAAGKGVVVVVVVEVLQEEETALRGRELCSRAAQLPDRVRKFLFLPSLIGVMD